MDRNRNISRLLADRFLAKMKNKNKRTPNQTRQQRRRGIACLEFTSVARRGCAYRWAEEMLKINPVPR